MKTSKDFHTMPKNLLKPRKLVPEEQGLGPVGLEAARHWREQRPKMYQDLQKAGVLNKALKNAEKRTLDAEWSLRQTLEEGGMNPQQAYHSAREKIRPMWVNLPNEQDQPILGQNLLDDKPQISE